MSPLQAVLFDMDGLLVDTEDTWFEAETEIMRRLGGQWSPADQEVLVGGPMERTTAYMLAKSGADLSSETLAEWLVAEMEVRLRTAVCWRPGARELLDEVATAGLPAALVSASYRSLMDAVLQTVGAHRFATTVAGDEVERTKPDPLPYLTAAARLRVDAARCVVLEDSATGVAAGLAAGCLVVAVPSVKPIPPRPGLVVRRSLTEVSVPSLRELLQSRAA